MKVFMVKNVVSARCGHSDIYLLEILNYC